jgi:dolichol-phosphate mannosyltransferase
VTLRLYSVYGPYEDPRRLIPTLISLGMRNQLPPLVSPDVARDFVAVEDVVDAFMLSAAAPGIERGATSTTWAPAFRRPFETPST